jgi:indole-3-glycerol phosphate synthase
VTERLAPRIPGEVMVIAESGIASASDVRRIARAGASAMLVGESLMRSDDVEAATKALLTTQ